MRRAILTHRTVMDVVGHNIANASTPGYHRQQAVLTTTDPFAYPGTNNPSVGQLGTGVKIQEIQRVVDYFIEDQLRVGTSSQSQLEIETETLRRVEAALMEPSTTEGLSDVLATFYNAWQDLSLNPDSTAARNQVLSAGQNLVDVINQIDQSLRDIRSDLNAQVREDVDEVNRILGELAILNDEIKKVNVSGSNPNDMLDTRDSLLLELSQYLDIKVTETGNGMIAVHSGSRQLLWNMNYNKLSDGLAWDHPAQNSQTPYFSNVSQADFNMLADFATGEFQGLLNSRDEIVPNVQEWFQDIVSTIMNEVNAVHSSGFGLQQFSQDLGSTTTGDIVISFGALAAGGVADNSVMLSSVDNVLVGDTLRIEETDTQQGDGIAVKVTRIEGNRVYFQTLEDLTLNKNRWTGDGLTTYQVNTGAHIYKIDQAKNLFFELATTLPGSFKADMAPEYTATMISTLQLHSDITLNTTLADIERIYGIDLTDAVNGKSVALGGDAVTQNFTESNTFGFFLEKINEMRPEINGGKEMELKFDEINHRLILKGGEYTSLSQLGGDSGSELAIMRLFGFEGQSRTGFQLFEGAALYTTTLGELGVADGYFIVDGVNLYADSTQTIRNNLDSWNATLNSNPQSTSFGTNIFFDPVDRRFKITSDHAFSVRDGVSQGGLLPQQPFIKSNFLLEMGLQSQVGQVSFSTDQQQASITSSDVGARIRVNEALLGNSNLVAAAANEAGVPGDNSIANAIGATRTLLTMNSTGLGTVITPNEAIEEYYDAQIGALGTRTQQANVDLEVTERFMDYYEQRREEVSGVSLDEEMTLMIEAQHAFAAASRMINVVDEMLDRIINGTGLAGR
jgi:flagellar hook-associated protein 1 FlgK